MSQVDIDGNIAFQAEDVCHYSLHVELLTHRYCASINIQRRTCNSGLIETMSDHVPITSTNSLASTERALLAAVSNPLGGF